MTCIPDKERPGEKRLWTEGGRPLASQQHWTFRRWRIPTHPVFGRRSVAPPRTPGSIGTIRSRKAMPIAQTDARRSGFCSPNLGPRIKISGHPGRSASFFEVYLFGLVLGALADGVDGTDVRLSARRNALLVFRILHQVPTLAARFADTPLATPGHALPLTLRDHVLPSTSTGRIEMRKM